MTIAFVLFARSMKTNLVCPLTSSAFLPSLARRKSREQFATGHRVEPLEARIAPAATVTLSGSLVGGVDLDGDGVADPGDTIHYTATIGNTGPGALTSMSFTELINDANLTLVAGSVNVSPLAIDDTFTAIGNTTLVVGTVAGVTGPAKTLAGSAMANDFEFLTDTIAGSVVISAFDATGTQGGTVTMVTSGANKGSFSYLPAAGFTGTDTFTYTLRDDGIDNIAGNADDLTSVGTVTVTVQGTDGTSTATAPVVWYVDSSVAATGDGRSSSPFKTIAEVSGATGPDAAGETIFLHTGSGNYAGGVTLLNTQTLWGQGEALIINGSTLQVAGTDPVIENAAGNGVSVANGATLKGFTVGNTTGFDIANTTTATVGALNISNVVLNGTGGLFRADSGGTLAVTFDSASTTSATGHGIHLGGATTGTFTVTTGAISGVAGTDVFINGGTAVVDIAASVTSNAGGSIEVASHGTNNVTLSGALNITGGTGLSVHNNTGGTIAFTNASKVISTGASNAVDLDANTGATINFTGGGLDIDTSSGTGFDATGGGTISVTGSGNTIDATSGTALNVVSTTISAGGLTFQRISSGTAASSTATGIILDTTGSSGGLTVTGTGSAGSGGTIQHKTGADGATTTGNGIYLNNTAHVSLTRMQLNDFDNSAIRGFSVTHFTLTNSVISGVSGNASGPTEGAITFGTSNPGGANGLLGTGANASLIDNVNVSGAVEHTIEVYNQSGSFGLTISNSNIHDNSVALGSDGILMEMQGTATATVLISGNQFSNNKSQAIQLAANDDSTFNATIRANTITRGTQGNEGIVLSNGSNGDLTAMIGGTTLADGNTISGFGGVSIFVGQTAGNATAASLLQATIQNNTVTTPASATNHAIIAFLSSTTGQVSQARILIDSNTVTQNATGGVSRSILVDAPDAGRTPEYHATVTNNNIDVNDGGTGTAVTQIAVQARNGATGHFDVRNNDVDFISAQPGGVVGVRVRADALGSVAQLARGVSGSNDPAVVVAANNLTASGTEILGTVTVINNGIVLLPATPPQPLFFAPLPVNRVTLPTDTPVAGVTPPPVVQTPVIIDDGILSQAELDSLVEAAIARWEATGLTAEQSALLHHVIFNVQNLAGWQLGEAGHGVVTLDADAAGNSWFIDATPNDDSEFSGVGTQLIATADGGAFGRVDALTTVLHELGHQLGLEDSYLDAEAAELMYGYLHQSERRLPALGEAVGAVAHDHDEMHALTFSPAIVNLSDLGQTLPVGKTLTIVYDGTINAALSNGLAPTVSSRIRFSSSAGNVDSNTVATTLDSLTLGDRVWNDADRNGTFNGAEVGINGVVMNLYADNGTTAGSFDAGDIFITTTTTAGAGASAGTYSFAGLLPGEYVVQVAQANFNVGGPLQLLPLSSPGQPDPDNNVDNDDNGAILAGNGAVSQAITLAYNTETTAGTGNDTNNTLDFGFMPLIADLSITKTDGSTTEIPGTNVTYTIVVSNAGPDTATGATVADTFAGILSGVSWTAVAAGGASGTLAGSGNINELVNLPSGASLTYTVTGLVSATATGSLANTATVTVPVEVTDPNLANNSATDTDTLTPQGDLSITKTDGAATEVPGTTVTYTIVASNSGPSTATGATVADTFAASLSSVTWTAVYAGGATGAANGSGNINQLVTLPSGGTATYTVTGTIAETATGSLVNTATVTAPGGFTDATPGNDSATDTDTLAPQTDLAITKTDGSTTEVPGTSVTYTIVATNNGPSFVTGATVADTFPATLTGVTWTAVFTGAGATGTANGLGNINELINLPTGGTATYTVTGTIASSATGSLSNTATITAPGGSTDPTPGNNSATDTDTLTPQADLAITKTDGSATEVPGTAVTYTITASNSGPSNVIGATVADTFPATLTGVTWTAVGAGGGTVAANGSGNINELVNLPSGASVTFTVTGTVAPTATGTLANTATVAAPGGVTDPNAGNNSATDTDTLTPQADLAITKTDGSPTEIPGTTVTYTITASNSGPSTVIGATVADTFPASLSGVTWTAVYAGGATGAANGSGNISELVNLPGGATATYTVTGTIAATATGSLSNTATIAAPGGVTDPTPANNSATDTDTLTPTVDLQITKTDGQTSLGPGANTYTIVVTNVGPSSVTGATVADTFPAGFTGATWTAVAAGGATGTLNGSGNINELVTMPVGGSITYTVNGTIPIGTTGTLTNTATITAPGGVTDSTPANNSATDNTTVISDDLSITKTDGVASVVPGNAVTYTIVVGNSALSTLAANGATVVDNFAATLTGVTWTAVGAGGATGTTSGSGNINELLNLPIGSTFTYTVTGTVSAAATGTLVNTATVTAPGGFTEADTSNNTATDTDTLTPDADLSITKTDGITSAVPGTANTYTITVTNNGPSTVTSLVLNDSVPAALLTPVFTPASGSYNPGTGAWTGLTLATGQSVTMTLSGTIDQTATGTLVNTATVSAPGVTDGTPGNNSATDTDTLTPQTDLSITKTDGSATEIPGTTVTYTIVATNSGPSFVTGATVADTFAASLSSVTWTAVFAGAGAAGTANGSGNINELINLPTGGTATYTVTGTIASSATGSLSNTATITAPGSSTDPTPGNNSATDTDTLTPQADLAITKTDGSATEVPGTTVTYTITASNSGPSNVIGATVADTFPATLTGVTWTAVGAGGGTVAANGSGNINELVNLPSGASVTFTVTGTVAPTATGTLANTATVAAPGGVTDPNAGNNSATDTDTLTPQADLAITKTDGIAAAVPGTVNTYTITVTNNGPSSVTSLVLNDTVPAALLSPVFTPTSGSYDSGTGAWTGLTLATGQSVTMTLSGTIDPAATGTLVNTASVSAPGATDANPGNDSATDTDTLVPAADLSITKIDLPDPAVPGGTLTYTVTVSNAGPSNVTGATVADTFPAGLSGVTWTAAFNGGATGTAAGAGNLSEIVNVPSGGSVVYTVTGTVTAAAGTSLTNTATVFSAIDTNNANDSATATTFVGGVDLVLTKDDSAVTVTPGGTLTYVLNYSNAGVTGATGVVLTETLPVGTSFNAAGSTAGWTETAPGSGIFTLNVGAVGIGGSGTANFSVTVDAVVAAGQASVFNTATISDDGASGADLTLADNTTSDTDTLDAEPDLQLVSKSDGTSLLVPGATNTYTISYANIGNQGASGVFIEDTLPVGTSFIAGENPGWVNTAGVLTYAIGSVDGGTSSSVTLILHVDNPLPVGQIQVVNTATIKDDDANGADPAGNDSSSDTDVLSIPVTLVNARTAKFVDVDGDLVTVRVSKGTLEQSDFVLVPAGVGGQLMLVDFSDDGSEFKGANITITATKKPGGNGMVNVGRINATGVDLGAARVLGDLGQIDAGDANLATTGLQNLVVGSLGVVPNTQLPGTVDPLYSEIAGRLGSLVARGSVAGVVDVAGGANGGIGRINILGNLDGSAGGLEAGLIRSTGNVGPLDVKGNLIGGADFSGLISGGKAGQVIVRGDLTSADAARPALISALGDPAAANQYHAKAIGGVQVFGNVLNARILAGFGYVPGAPAALVPMNPDAAIGSIYVGGAWTASSAVAGVADATADGFGQNDALIAGDITPNIIASIASITIKGLATGTVGGGDHFGLTAQRIAKIKIGTTSIALTTGADNVLLDTANNDFRAVDFA